MKTDTARFDTRLSKEQKELFEFAANLGGYRSLTDFVISSAQQKANEIVQPSMSGTLGALSTRTPDGRLARPPVDSFSSPAIHQPALSY